MLLIIFYSSFILIELINKTNLRVECKENKYNCITKIIESLSELNFS